MHGGAPFILLVEDERAVQTFARLALERQGCAVHVTDRAEDALAWAEEHIDDIDLVIADVVLPDMGGRELAWRLRKARPGLRVLLVSGIADDATLEGFGEGVAFLPKPFGMQELWDAVCDLLDGIPEAC